MSLKDTPVRQRMLCMTFWVYVRTIQRLNYSGQEHTRHTCDLETRSRSSNLVQLLDTKQGYNNAKFEKPCLNSVRDKANEKCFCQIRKHANLSPSKMYTSKEKKKKWRIHDLLNVLNNPTKFQLNQIRTKKIQLKLFDTVVTLK